MPKIATENRQIVGTSFEFSGAGMDRLQETGYTVVTVAVDVTGSTIDFADDLLEMVKSAVGACKRNRVINKRILLRVITFSTQVGVRELHGFVPLDDIDMATDYPPFNPDGLTNLFDAVHAGVGAMVDYGADLIRNDYDCNGLFIVITDGANNQSQATTAMIKERITSLRRAESLESLMTIVIGINTRVYLQVLEEFVAEAGLDIFIDAGNVTEEVLAKIAGFIESSSVETSTALGSGAPSKDISATI